MVSLFHVFCWLWPHFAVLVLFACPLPQVRLMVQFRTARMECDVSQGICFFKCILMFRMKVAKVNSGMVKARLCNFAHLAA